MARFRLSRPAQADLAQILTTSETRWGIEASRRYSALLSAAILRVADDPGDPVTRDRSDLSPGIRSLHLRYVHDSDLASRVKAPVHVLYYRSVRPDLVEIVRVLHERMDPDRHFSESE